MSQFKQESEVGLDHDFNPNYVYHDGETLPFFNLDSLPNLSELDQFEIIEPSLNGFIEDQEDTMDVANKYEIIQPLQINNRGPPKREIFAGIYDFHVEVKSQDTHKKKYLYSHHLNRIYVDMDQNFSIQFVWDYKKAGGVHSSLLVRATTVFSDISQAEKRVERCVQHTHDPRNKDIDKAIVQNVLHSARELDSLGVSYCGDPNLTDSWYSVLVEFTPRGDACNHAYKFVCKNSCSSGINRRGIDIIFTLEDRDGTVLGRQSVGARVCSCPRRDMIRDEGDAPRHKNKRPVTVNVNSVSVNVNTPADPPPAKKTKIQPLGDAAVVTLPPLQIVGSRAVITGLEVMLSMMQQAASFKKNDPQALATYNTSIQGLKTKIEEFKNGAKPPPPAQ